jgi:medium-chain acyl-[acyl-carrier-protein] hydrolase
MPELLAVLLPVLRADFQICETYAHRREPKLDCPITAFGGLADSLVSRERVLAWRDLTSGSFRAHLVAGDHFFVRGAPAAVVQRVAAELAWRPGLLEAS